MQSVTLGKQPSAVKQAKVIINSWVHKVTRLHKAITVIDSKN